MPSGLPHGGHWGPAISVPNHHHDASFGYERKALEAQLLADIKQFGPNAPPTLISKSNLATSLAKENPQLSEKLHREVLKGKLKHNSSHSVIVAITQNGLGSLLRKQPGRIEEAIPFLEAALRVRESIPGQEMDAAVTRDELGCCLQALGRHAEARAMRLRKGEAGLICSNEPCSKTAKRAGVRQLLLCGRCRSIWYCSAACQKADWKQNHKAVCKAAGTEGGA